MLLLLQIRLQRVRESPQTPLPRVRPPTPRVVGHVSAGETLDRPTLPGQAEPGGRGGVVEGVGEVGLGLGLLPEDDGHVGVGDEHLEHGDGPCDHAEEDVVPARRVLLQPASD